MPGYMDVSAAIEAAKQAIAQKRRALATIDSIRSDLRHAVLRGEGTPEERKWVAEMFPIRERTRSPKNKTVAPKG